MGSTSRTAATIRWWMRGIEIGLLGDQRDLRAPPAGVRDGHAGRDPGALGHRIGGDHAAIDGSGERDDPQWSALQLVIGLLFTRGKEAVEINVQLLRVGFHTRAPWRIRHEYTSRKRDAASA